MTGERPSLFWLICWKYVSPLGIIVVLIANVYSLAKTGMTYTAYVGCQDVSSILSFLRANLCSFSREFVHLKVLNQQNTNILSREIMEVYQNVKVEIKP